MSCASCGSTMNLQVHHDQYHPPKTRLLCVKCHREIHNHGVGRAPGYTMDDCFHKSKKLKKPMMVYDRNEKQGDINVALHRVSFCLNQFEKHGLEKGLSLETEISHHFTIEECLGALVSAEQNLLEYAKNGRR